MQHRRFFRSLSGRRHAYFPGSRHCLVVLLPPMRCVPLRPLVGDGTLGEGLFRTANVWETLLGALGEPPEKDGPEIGRHGGVMVGRAYHLIPDVSDHPVHRIRAVEWRTAGQERVAD